MPLQSRKRKGLDKKQVIYKSVQNLRKADGEDLIYNKQTNIDPNIYRYLESYIIFFSDFLRPQSFRRNPFVQL